MVVISTAQVQAIDDILSRAVETNQTPALFFGVTDAQRIIYSKAVGRKHCSDPTGPSVDADTVHMLCSQTKLITSIAALQLVDSGMLSLSTPVSVFFPEFANAVVMTGMSEVIPRPAQRTMTVGHLFNHTSGLSYTLGTPWSWSDPGIPYFGTHVYSSTDGPAKFFELAKGKYENIPLEFEPGTGFAYGYSTDVIGFIIEQISGLSLAEYFEKHIFAPLGVTSATFYPVATNRLSMTLRSRDGTFAQCSTEAVPILPQDPDDVNMFQGGGGLYSSQSEYLLVLQHLLQILDGSATDPLISLEATKSLFAPTLSESGIEGLDTFLNTKHSQFGNGLRVNTIEQPGRRKEGSGEWFGWANTYFWVDPTSGIAAVFGTQIAPPRDPTVLEIYGKLEEAVYLGVL